jgi:carboxyl-terminal processing protease
MTPDDVAKMASETVGSFGGVGIVVSMRSGRLTVIAPMAGTPAERAGILAGDEIAAIDGAPTDRLSMRDAVGLMRGKIGTRVELTLRRGDRELTVTVVRAEVAIKPTSASMISKAVGYLRISSFMHGKLSELVREAITRLVGQGARALIIDLRNNPGGLLTEAHKIADLFVKRGVILSTRTRLPGESRKLMADPKSDKFEMPLAVLINGGSASASEILAGTLKEHGLAIVIGERSFGKGSVQRVLPLDTYKCALALTVATYHLPSGATPHKKGVMPDVVIKLSEEEARRVAERTNYAPDEALADPQLEEARKRLRAKLSRN